MYCFDLKKKTYSLLQRNAFLFPLCPGTENDGGSVKKEKEKKNRKKDKENSSGSGEAGNQKDIDAPDAVVSTV